MDRTKAWSEHCGQDKSLERALWTGQKPGASIVDRTKAWSKALWTGQKPGARHCGQDKRIFFCPVHNASTPCSLQAFGIRCMAMSDFENKILIEFFC